MLKTYSVYRIGKCTKCRQNVRELIEEVEAENTEEAINKAIENWSSENFGQAGALRENDKLEEELFLDAEFVAHEEKDEHEIKG